MTATGLFLFVVLPYVCLASFVIGHIWRYRYDKFGWTTRSSQWYESRLLRWASPMFHFGLLGVIAGHVVGLLIPESWTEFIGMPEWLYQQMALWLGGISGVVMVIGLIGLIYRRRTTPSVFRATTKTDKLMYAMLALVIGLGLSTTVYWQLVSGPYDYRLSVSVYFRSIFYFQPQPELMQEAPILFQLHALAAFLLFAVWPYTRLVHVLSAPVGYIWRPYIVYRSRTGSRAGHHGESHGAWEQPGMTQTTRRR